MRRILEHFFTFKTPPPESRFNSALLLLESIKPEVFVQCHSSDLSIFSINVLFSSILTYTEKIKSATMVVTNRSIIFKHEYNHQELKVGISEFFTDERKRYIDEISAAKKFIAAVKDFFLTIQEAEQLINDEPTLEHDLRALQKTIQNLLYIIDRFKEYSESVKK